MTDFMTKDFSLELFDAVLCCVSLETTGTDPKRGGEIYEIGWVKYRGRQKLDTFNSATFKTFWQVLDCILKLQLHNESNLSKKKTAFVMPRVDDSLDFKTTYDGYKRMFPNIKSFKIDLTGHYPVEPLTLEFIESKFPNLLKEILQYLRD